MLCALEDLAYRLDWGPCGNSIHTHHVLSKSMLAGNKKARDLVEGKYRVFFLAQVCDRHNVGRFADSKLARGFLIARFCREFMEPALAEVRACYKQPPHWAYDSLTQAYFRWRDAER